MIRTGECNHCGQCCGALLPDNTRNNPWDGAYPIAHDEWSKESLLKNPLYSLIPHPNIAGHHKGRVTVDGKTFEYEWLVGVGLVKSEDDQCCPFLVFHSDKEEAFPTYRCGLYGTSGHHLWETICQPFPARKATVDQVKSIFIKFPNCSHVYEPVVGED